MPHSIDDSDTITSQREKLHLTGEIKKGLQIQRLCIMCQDSNCSRFDDVTSLKPVPQLLQAIIHVKVAYILIGLNVSPAIQNMNRIEKQSIK